MRKKHMILFGLLIVIGLPFYFAYLIYSEHTKEIESSNWGKEGEWIVFTCGPTGRNEKSILYLVRPDGTETTRLTTDQFNAASPSWSPDGEEIIFEKTIGELHKLQRGTKTLTPLSIADQINTSEEYPAWSPDGQWIAFISYPIQLEQPPSLSAVNSDGSVLKTVANNVDRYPVAWSPDGQWIFYSANGALHKVRVDGTEAQEVVPWRMSHFDISPNGDFFVFDDFNDIFLAKEDGREKRQLTVLPYGAFNPTWSPDGQWIVFTYFESTKPQLYKINRDGSELQQVTEMDCGVGSSDWIRMPENE